MKTATKTSKAKALTPEIELAMEARGLTRAGAERLVRSLGVKTTGRKTQSRMASQLPEIPPKLISADEFFEI